MSIFPTKILLATDGSSEAQLAAQTAVDLAQKTDSELHAVHVVDVASSIALLYPEATDPKRVENIALLYPEATDPERVEQLAPVLKEALERPLEQRGREVLDGEVERVRSAGGTVAQSHLMMGEVAREIVHLAEDLGAGLISDGQQGPRGDKESAYGQRIRVRGQARPLPGHDSPRVRSNHDLRRRRIPRTSPREASPKSGLLPGPLSVA